MSMQPEREQRLLTAVAELVRVDQFLIHVHRLSAGMIARAVMNCHVVDATKKRLVLEAEIFYYRLINEKEKKEAIRCAYAAYCARTLEEYNAVKFDLMKQAKPMRAAA